MMKFRRVISRRSRRYAVLVDESTDAEIILEAPKEKPWLFIKEDGSYEFLDIFEVYRKKPSFFDDDRIECEEGTAYKICKSSISPVRHLTVSSVRKIYAEYAAKDERDYDCYNYKSSFAFVYGGFRFVFPRSLLLYFYTCVLPKQIAEELVYIYHTEKTEEEKSFVAALRSLQSNFRFEMLKYALNFPMQELGGNCIQKIEQAYVFTLQAIAIIAEILVEEIEELRATEEIKKFALDGRIDVATKMLVEEVFS